jgi:hypothetical protein
LKLTVDSSEPVQDAIRAVGALYGVTLVVSERAREVSKPAQRSRTNSKKRSGDGLLRTGGGVAEASSAKSRTRGAGSAGALSNADVRSWARHAGLAVSNRGRVPASVITAYRSAH